MVTHDGSALGPKKMEQTGGPALTFLSALSDSSRVKGKSNQRLLVRATGCTRPKISMLEGALCTSWEPTSTLTPTITRVGSLLVTSRVRPAGLVQATYMPVVFSRCFTCKRHNRHH
ncbi:unnamed protein product [Ixodes pacificus]